MLLRIRIHAVRSLKQPIRRLMVTPTPPSTRIERHVVESRFKRVEIPDETVNEFVWKNVDRWLDKTAIECGITGRGYTYSELRERSRRFGSSLHRMGLEPGSVVGVVMPNTPDYPVAVLGAFEAGLVVSTFNPGYTPDEISKQLVDAGPRVLVCQPEKYEDVVEAVRLAAAQGYKSPRLVVAQSAESCVVPQGALSLEEMVGPGVDTSALPQVKVDPNTVATIPYSSGTTGLPKGVCLSHRNMVTNTTQMNTPPSLQMQLPTTASYQDVMPAVLPFYHIYGLQGTLLSALWWGVKIVTLPKFSGNIFLDLLKKHKATVLYVVPPLVMFLGMSNDVTTEHLQSVRAVSSGAAPIGEIDTERFLNRAPKGVHFVQGYGLTEASPLVFFSELGCKKLTSVGKILPNTRVKVIDVDTGEPLGSGGVGEVCVQGPQVMLGYHNNPQATSEMIDQSGWLHTGDLGYYDEDEDFFIVDRIKELIKVKGYQVAPAELEELLRSHPAVLDAAVIGIPDRRAGEVPLAFVVPKATGAMESAQFATDIKEFVASKVSAHKHLGQVRVVESIPKNASGKILRKDLREMVKKEQASK